MANACVFFIWSSFFRHLHNLFTVITSSLSSFSWAHLFFTYLGFLCFSSPAHQLTRLMGKYAESMGAVAEPDPNDQSDCARFRALTKKFSIRPTLLLRAVVPSTGFSVTFRGLLDTGATCSVISRDLATVLFEEGGASFEYIWPQYFFAPFHERPRRLQYRKVVDVKLQSVEDETTEWTLPSIHVEECKPNMSGCHLPVDLLVSKMASLKLPIVSSAGLGRTMWTKSEQQ